MAAYIGENAPIYLLAILRKGDLANFSASEVAEMQAVLAETRKSWREREK